MKKIFKIHQNKGKFSGIEGEKISATYALADQLRLQNYIRILELKSDLNKGIGCASKRDEILDSLLEQLEEEV